MKLGLGWWWCSVDYGPKSIHGDHLSTLTLFNWLEKDHRFWGRRYDYYDGPIYSLGFWYFNMGVMWPGGWDQRLLSAFFWDPKEDK